ncbi:hypothetical protein GF367_03480 [Candidatus Woesearchaeota archaeon]|nr:hypothetical protein [Candidatus Woesearchaeota archaeon]
MARKAGLVLRLFIFVLLWVVGGLFFGEYGGAIGMQGSMLFIGESIVGTGSLARQGGDVILLIASFIITAAVYYLVAVVITFFLVRAFGRK